MRATAYLLSSLAAEGVDHLFLVPGDLASSFAADLVAFPGLGPIAGVHETGVAAMAEGYAWASGRFGVVVGGGEAGSGGLVAAAATAWADASPVLFLTGQATADSGRWTGGREAIPAVSNGAGLLGPVMAQSLAVWRPGLLPQQLRACLTRMLAGPKAPVHLALSPDVAAAVLEAPAWEPLDESLARPRYVDMAAVERLWRVLVPEGGGEAPVRVAILAGAGVEKSGATEHLIAFAEQFDLPVATTARAKGVFPEDHRLSLGVFGPAGHRHAVETLLSGQVELLIVLGCDLARQKMFFGKPALAPCRLLVQVDADPAVIGRAFRAHVPIVGDCRSALVLMMEGGSARIMRFRAGNQARLDWLRAIRGTGPACRDFAEVAGQTGVLHPAAVATALRQALPREAVVAVDTGAHQSFFSHYFQAYGPRTYAAAVEPAPAGWAVPAAIGIKAALPAHPVVCVTGDGGMLTQGREVATAVRYGLRIVYVVLNTGTFARPWAKAAGEGGEAPPATFSWQDFAAFGRSLGARGGTVTRIEELPEAFAAALAGQGPYVLDIHCAQTTASEGLAACRAGTQSAGPT